jgi:hypothetical protein
MLFYTPSTSYPTVRHFPIAFWAPDGGPNVEPDGPKSPPDVGFSTSGLGPAATSMNTLQDMHARRGRAPLSIRYGCGARWSTVLEAA